MKELKELPSVYLEDYDVHVKRFLELDEIEGIAGAAVKQSLWMKQQEVIILGTLMYVTDIGKEKLEEIGYAQLMKSGLFDAVAPYVANFYMIQQAIDYQRSVTVMLAKLASSPAFAHKIEKIMDNPKVKEAMENAGWTGNE